MKYLCPNCFSPIGDEPPMHGKVCPRCHFIIEPRVEIPIVKENRLKKERLKKIAIKKILREEEGE